MIDRRPAMIAGCRSSADVSAAVRAATARNLEIAVRGGGHSIPGHSVCDDGLVIDLSVLNSVRVYPDQRMAVVGGGALLRDLDKATQLHGMATPAGAVSHTGVGGLTLGGGFGHLMRKHGLTVDSLLEVELCLPTGRSCAPTAVITRICFGASRWGRKFWHRHGIRLPDPPIAAPYVGIVIHELGDAPAVLRTWAATMSNSPPDELNWCTFFRFADAVPGIPTELKGRPMLVSLLEWHGEAATGAHVVDDLVTRLQGVAAITSELPFLQLQTFIDEISEHGNRVWTKAGFFGTIDEGLIHALVASAAEITSWRSTLEVLPLGGKIAEVPLEATAFPSSRQLRIQRHRHLGRPRAE